MTAIVPIAQLQRRAPEAGRIRLGVKTGKAMKSIDTFRFTSTHRKAIEQLAELYGGTPQPWSDPKAAPNQWEVVTDASSIEVLAQPGGLSTWYELWSGGGCTRRCDGVTVEVPGGPDGMVESACICAAKGVAECDPYTRLNVVLPQLDFYGVWRMQTKGWNAAKELPGMFDMVVALAQEGRMVRAFLNLEQRKQIKSGQTRNFVVPTITVAASPDELLAGGGVARPQLNASPSPAGAPQLGSGVPPRIDDDDRAIEMMADAFDAEVVDAEVVDDEREMKLESQVRDIAGQHGHDETAVVATLWSMAGGDLEKIERFIAKNDGTRKLDWTKDGKLKWTTSS